MDMTYATYSGDVMTSWGNRVSGDLTATTLDAAAAELLAEIAGTPEHLRPPVDEIRLWSGASPALPAREPDYVQQVPA
jgi:hypothetical protein